MRPASCRDNHSRRWYLMTRYPNALHLTAFLTVQEVKTGQNNVYMANLAITLTPSAQVAHVAQW